MMKSILIIIFGLCVGLPLGINGARGGGESSKRTGDGGESSKRTEDPYQRALRKHGDSVKIIQDIAEKGESINGVLKPLKFLDCGGVGVVFRGVRLEDNKPVAIKFIDKRKADNARREYAMYSYMKAINQTDVEKYGITAIYYYGTWKKFIVTAYTYLEETLADRSESSGLETPDILFVIQQFIKQSKYVHSCGVRHNDVKLENILTRNCESFLVDFDHASQMMQENRGQSILMAPLRFHMNQNRVPIDDWESFLYTICDLTGLVPLEWFDESLANLMIADKNETKQLIGNMKANRTRILDVIKKSLRKNVPLQTVLVALANEVFSDKLIPNYDEFDAMVTDVLSHAFSDKKCFSWVMKPLEGKTVDLSHQTKIQESIAKKHEIKIGDINVPNNFEDYRRFKYPRVNENKFQEAQPCCTFFK